MHTRRQGKRGQVEPELLKIDVPEPHGGRLNDSPQQAPGPQTMITVMRMLVAGSEPAIREANGEIGHHDFRRKRPHSAAMCMKAAANIRFRFAA